MAVYVYTVHTECGPFKVLECWIIKLLYKTIVLIFPHKCVIFCGNEKPS